VSAELERCGLCGKLLNQTPPIAGIYLWVPGVRKPYLLWSPEEFVVCAHPGCPSVLQFIRRSIDGNEVTRTEAVGWCIAKVTFYDPEWPDWRLEPTKPAQVARA
jgi:hypothetical protein